MNKMISVIVPVYNVEHDLEECIESIIHQTYENIEVILVDDGSTDRSGEICDYYATIDERIIVIHKENGGNSSARKAGIRESKGEYLLFVDSDDWIEITTCEKMMNIIQCYDVDMVRFALAREYSNRRVICKDSFDEGVYDKARMQQIVHTNIFVYNGGNSTNNSLCSQIVSRDVLIHTFERMGDEVQYGEDLAYVILSLLSAERLYITHEVFYHYRMRDGSITHSDNVNYYRQINSLYSFLCHCFSKRKDAEKLISQLDLYMDELTLRGINYRFHSTEWPKIPRFYFPLDMLHGGERLVIYGIGDVGKSYLLQLKSTGLYDICCVVDKNQYGQDFYGMTVREIDSLIGLEYDKLIIAVKDEIVAKHITDKLVDDYKIDKEKIMWCAPKLISDYYHWSYERD